ncbi:TetR/AcrR family transcriptional regulator [Polymorphospora rubra]|uniref:TetR family transcriptional regulator n=1 Tax=Polymorphospora rubra TaxID=338584 RepID=A0A810N773_9ACTN|nr:TetR/AcrR family transcriptional regulator [Polymorphospora rubra]BCJ69432.1 TetR family transcriptional regulator [Polymorphospora rubra]
MPRKAGRPPEQTRRILLDAAATVIRNRGITATLDDIAREAGVSKGGLIYHFASKDELILALATDLLDAFRRAVHAALSPDDQTAGRLTRAYLHACLDPTDDEHTIRESLTLTAHLITSPEVAALAQDDAQRWQAELGADGLPADLVTLVVAAADGASYTPIWGGSIRTAAHQRLKHQLIALTHDPSAWKPVGRYGTAAADRAGTQMPGHRQN